MQNDECEYAESIPAPKCPAAVERNALAAERDRWIAVAKDVCARMDYECPPECDSHGHAPNCGIFDLCVTVDNLRARLAEAERDAARYRWLRDIKVWPPTILPRMCCEEWDAMIDAAMAAETVEDAV